VVDDGAEELDELESLDDALESLEDEPESPEDVV
jgi:hypothetical protein